MKAQPVSVLDHSGKVGMQQGLTAIKPNVAEVHRLAIVENTFFDLVGSLGTRHEVSAVAAAQATQVAIGRQSKEYLGWIGFDDRGKQQCRTVQEELQLFFHGSRGGGGGGVRVNKSSPCWTCRGIPRSGPSSPPRCSSRARCWGCWPSSRTGRGSLTTTRSACAAPLRAGAPSPCRTPASTPGCSRARNRCARTSA